MLSQEKFNENFRNLINSETSSFLLAVSGGVDSMVLLWLFANLKSQILDSFVVAHVNYKLRGKDSDSDQKLVQSFCEKYNIKLHIYEVSDRDKKPEGSIQLWARELRYRFFRKIQEKENLDFLVTAHHLNDQLETFLINLSRGSGITGLSGIPAGENQILRPLLGFSKAEIYAFAEKNNIPFREDASNQKNDYLRNKIRNKISPELSKISPDFLKNFQKSLQILGQSKDFITSQIEKILTQLTLKKDDDLWILDKEILNQETDFIKFEILKKFGFESENEIYKIFTAETGKIFHSNHFSLLIDRNQIIINVKNKKRRKEQGNIIFETLQNTIDLRDFLTQNNLEKYISEDFWLINSENIKLPLQLRKPQNGDFFQPKGMSGKKKISKFLKDEKIPLLDRKKMWLLCDDLNQILGVFPLRQSENFVAKSDNFVKILLK